MFWRLNEIPEGLEIRLFWHTLGKGDTDVGIVDVREIPAPASQGDAEFCFEAPRSPTSFSGQLISLFWAVELVVLPKGDEAGRRQIVISPTGEEIVLARPATEDD